MYIKEERYIYTRIYIKEEMERNHYVLQVFFLDSEDQFLYKLEAEHSGFFFFKIKKQNVYPNLKKSFSV